MYKAMKEQGVIVDMVEMGFWKIDEAHSVINKCESPSCPFCPFPRPHSVLRLVHWQTSSSSGTSFPTPTASPAPTASTRSSPGTFSRR